MSFFDNNNKVRNIFDFVQDLFAALLIVLLLLLLIETFFSGSVTSNFNFNNLLIAVMALGVLAIISGPKSHGVEARRPIGIGTAIFIGCVVLCSVLFIWHTTRGIGWISYAVSGLGGLLVSLMLVLVPYFELRLKDKSTFVKIARIVTTSYFQLSLLFTVLVLLKVNNIDIVFINYRIFACIIPLFAIPGILSLDQTNRKSSSKISLLVIAGFFFVILIRLIPYTGNDIPLGYDAGIYKYVMERYSAVLPAFPEADLPEWIRGLVPQGFPILTDTFHLIPGLSAIQLMQWFFIAMGALLVFPIFVVTRKLFGIKAGIIAVILYALSFTQYSAFTFAYFKNVLGLYFFLLAIYSLESRKYVLMALMYVGLGMFHRPEFLLFSLILVPYFFRSREVKLLYTAVLVVILLVPMWLPRIDLYVVAVGGAVGEAGVFFSFTKYQQVALAYLPFSLIGFIYMLVKKKWNSIFFAFVIIAVIIVGRILFYDRYIIPFDIIMIILAAVGISYTLLNLKGAFRVVGMVVLLLVLASSGIITIRDATQLEPLINTDQLAAIEWIEDNTEEDAFIIASSYDAPWVLGWSGRKVIAPGMFEWNEHNQQEWITFFKTNDIDGATQFLDEYEQPLYIYSSNNSESYIGIEKFNNQYFAPVYNDVAIVYRYYPGGMP